MDPLICAGNSRRPGRLGHPPGEDAADSQRSPGSRCSGRSRTSSGTAQATTRRRCLPTTTAGPRADRLWPDLADGMTALLQKVLNPSPSDPRFICQAAERYPLHGVAKAFNYGGPVTPAVPAKPSGAEVSIDGRSPPAIRHIQRNIRRCHAEQCRPDRCHRLARSGRRSTGCVSSRRWQPKRYLGHAGWVEPEVHRSKGRSSATSFAWTVNSANTGAAPTAASPTDVIPVLWRSRSKVARTSPTPRSSTRSCSSAPGTVRTGDRQHLEYAARGGIREARAADDNQLVLRNRQPTIRQRHSTCWACRRIRDARCRQQAQIWDRA